jgi:hypothetical protein
MFLWAPPPAVADVTMEELLKSGHKRANLIHVVVIPRLMAPRWHHLFNKVCDFTFVVSPGLSFWPTNMYTPLWVGAMLPFVHCRHCSLKQAPLLVEMDWELWRVLEASEGDGGDNLQKLLHLPKRLAPLLQRVACGILHIPWCNKIPNVHHS